MEHPHVMQHQHQHQHRTPIQSHDHLPQQQQRPSPRRPSSSSRGRIYRGEESGGGGGGGSENHQHPGHIMQSRTTSSAHVLSKRARSRSKGRRRRKEYQDQQQPHQKGRPTADGGGGRRTSQESSFHDSTHSHRFSEEANDTSFGSSQINNVTELLRDGKINEYGRCIRHPTIELCCQDSKNSPWRVLLQDCPLCSLDDSGFASLRPETNHHRMNDGGSWSQATPTPSTKTNRTLTTEEESSVKSWTMSDASYTSETESNISTTASTATREQLFIPRPPPKPPSNFVAPPKDQNSFHRGSNHQTQQQQNNYHQNNNPTIFDPVQSLKELGRKLVMESEQQQQQQQEASFENIFDDISMGMRSQASSSAATAQSRRFPPPPPPPAGMRSNNRASQREDNDELPRRKDSTGESTSSLSNKELSQIRRNRVGPPPRRGGGGGTAGALAAATGGVGGPEESNGSILGEASDIIARMESLTVGETATVGSSRQRSRRQHQQPQQHQQQQQPQQHQQQQMMDTGAGDVGDDDVARAAAEAAAEKRARHQRRKEKAERKAAKLRARELRHQQQQQQGRQEEDGSQTFTLPMNDVARSASRGRAEGGRKGSADDITQAAAQDKAERKAAKLRARELWHQQQQQQERSRQEKDGSQTFTLPMNDVVSSASRGREGRTDDILQAAAQIRARARRSTSRSRERVKEASFFCGEAPVDDDDNNDDAGDDYLSFSSEKKRSILNPLGLDGGQPRPPAVERRSQSREKRRSNDINNDQEEAPLVRERRGGSRGRKGRNRDKEDYSDMLQNQQTTAKDLLTRRREMRQQIAERQHNATQTRNDHRRSGSGGEQAVDDQLSHLSLKEEVMEGWSRGENPPSLAAYTDNTGSATRSVTSRRSSRRTEEGSEQPRRSRSRSAVRDGMSKIRSSSLFRKKGEKQGGIGAAETGGGDMWATEMSMEEKTFDSGKRSTSSFKRLLSRTKPRSRSRGRSSMSRSGHSIPNNNDDEPPDVQRRGSFRSNHEQGFGDFDARSAGAKSEKSSSRSFGIFNKSSSKNKKKSKGGMGMVRSLSRGSFRNNGDDGSERQNSRDFDYDSYSWEVGSMRSSSSGKVPRGLSRGDVGEC